MNPPRSTNQAGRQSRDADRERVREASDIVRIVGESVSLKPKGREYVGLCPFHDDHRPSMNVVPSKQIFHCFVCGAGGDVFTFVQKLHKMEFPEALRYLAERAGITLAATRGGGEAGTGSSRSDLLGACALAAEFYRGVLAHPEHGKVAREAMERRGFDAATSERFLIGAAPNRWDGLVITARSRGVDVDLLVEAGVLKSREQGGGVYDAMRNRLIFPIQDQAGRVIAFGGRRLDDAEEPKYLNTAESRLFKKGETLYALHHASRAIQTKRTAIVTEGYTDVIACHRAGVTNAVATLGTALTRDHAGVLRRMCDRVVLLFDGDEAGKMAADRAVDVFFAEPLDVAIATLSKVTDAKDPDELLKRPGGREVLERAIEEATDVLRYRFDRLRERLAGAGVAALSRAIEEEIAWLASKGLAEVSPVRQRLIIRQLAGLAGVDEGTIQRMLPAGRVGRVESRARPEAAEDGDVEQARRLQGGALGVLEHLLGCILCEGALWGSLGGGGAELAVAGGYRFELTERLAQRVNALAVRGVRPDLSAVLTETGEEPSLQQAAVTLASRVDAECDRDSERVRAHFATCLARARRDRERPGSGGQRDGDMKDMDRVIEAIGRKRSLDSAHGADRRVFPRPG